MTRLGDICTYRNETTTVEDARAFSIYVSTDSMTPNRGSVAGSTLPNAGKVKHFLPGDTLISNIRPYFKKIWRADEEGACSNDILIFQPRSCSSDYLHWVLSDDKFFSYVSKTSKGTKMPRGDKRAIMEYETRIPSDSEQNSICAVMNTIQSKIDLNNRINDYLAELLDAKFGKLLEDADGWNEASLLDIANYKNGLAMQKFRPKSSDSGLPVLKIRELGRGCCGPDSERCQSDIDEAVLVHDGDLVFSWSGTLLLDFWAGGDAGLNQHLFKVTSAAYPSWFYYMWTKYHLRKFIAIAKDRATTMGHIKRSALADSKVLIPEQLVLDGLTRSMQPIVNQMILNKVENRQLSNLRNALLPKLMSGEIDFSKLDITNQNMECAQ